MNSQPGPSKMDLLKQRSRKLDDEIREKTKIVQDNMIAKLRMEQDFVDTSRQVHQMIDRCEEISAMFGRVVKKFNAHVDLSREIEKTLKLIAEKDEEEQADLKQKIEAAEKKLEGLPTVEETEREIEKMTKQHEKFLVEIAQKEAEIRAAAKERSAVKKRVKKEKHAAQSSTDEFSFMQRFFGDSDESSSTDSDV